MLFSEECTGIAEKINTSDEGKLDFDENGVRQVAILEYAHAIHEQRL